MTGDRCSLGREKLALMEYVALNWQYEEWEQQRQQTVVGRSAKRRRKAAKASEYFR